MGATNTTTHYNLSQFVSTDKPAWLQDYNGDMAKIDAGIDAAKVAADTAQTTANSASGAATQAANDITALGVTVTGQGNNITALQLAVNTINSLIGNGTPTTTDQTIIGAINEINAYVHKDIEVNTASYPDFSTLKANYTTQGNAYTFQSDAILETEFNPSSRSGSFYLAIGNTVLGRVSAPIISNGALSIMTYIKKGMSIWFTDSNFYSGIITYLK